MKDEAQEARILIALKNDLYNIRFYIDIFNYKIL
jgi:hypothetical protein